MPYTKPVEGATVSYKMVLPEEIKKCKTVNVIVVVNPRLLFITQTVIDML